MSRLFSFPVALAALLSVAAVGAQPTADEKNTIDAFKRSAPSVVHVKSSEGSGTGFVLDSEGRILTNYHVIERSTNTTLLLDGCRILDARLIGTEPLLDLAVLQAATAGNDDIRLQPIPLGDSDALEIGEKCSQLGIHWVCTRP